MKQRLAELEAQVAASQPKAEPLVIQFIAGDWSCMTVRTYSPGNWPPHEPGGPDQHYRLSGRRDDTIPVEKLMLRPRRNSVAAPL